MKLLEKFESKKGNKLIFRQSTSDIPSLGSVVFYEKKNQNQSNQKDKKYREIGKIIDVFGPVKEPWIVVNLSKELEVPFENFTFYWSNNEHSKKRFFKEDKDKKRKRNKN